MWCIRIVLLFLIITTKASAQPKPVFNKSFAERYTYVDSLRLYMIYNITDRDVAENKLNEWIKNAAKHHDKALKWQLNFSRIYIPGQEKNLTLEKEVLKDIEYALRDGYRLEAADGYYILAGWVDNHFGKKAKAMEYALLGYELCKDAKIKDYPPKVKTLYRLAEWYYAYKEYEMSKHILFDLKEPDHEDLYATLSAGEYNTLALTYRELGQFDSAIFYFNKIYEDKLHKAPLAVRGIAAGNIGIIYKRRDDLASALIWMKKELELWRAESGKTISLSCFSAYIGIANIYYDLGNNALGDSYLDTARLIRRYHYDINVLARYYKLCARRLKVEGNANKALLYIDSFLVAKDSISRKAGLSTLLDAEKKVAAAKHELELAELDTLRQRSIWIRNFAILFIAFVAVVLILLINRNRLKYKQRELALEYEKKKAEAALATFTSKMQENNLQMVQLREELAELSNEQDIAAKNELIRQLQQSTILTDEQWEEFRNVFEQVHNGFIQRIRENYPDVTPAELHYIVLVKLNMTNKEIANVLGISVNSVRNYKFRLRKKFNLDENEDLETLIRTL